MEPRCQVLAVSLLLSSCQHLPSGDALQPIDVAQAVNEQAALSQSTVVVSGLLRYGDDMRALWHSRDASEQARGALPDDAIWNKCLTVYAANPAIRRQMLRANDTIIIIRGRLQVGHGPDRVDDLACNDVAVIVERVERHSGP